MRGAGSDAAPPRQLVKIAEGRQAEIFAWSEREVLRLYRDPNSGALADREVLALDAVRSAMPRAPAAYARIAWNGRPGILMERLAGRGLFAEIQRRPWRVWALAALTGRVHAELNAVRAPAALPELKSEIARRIDADPSIPDGLRASALEELERLPDGDALCHGDFHPENVVLCPSGPVVIDWPNAARGDPCGDFARSVLILRVGSLPPGSPALIRFARALGQSSYRRAYVAGYVETKRYEEAALRRWQLVRAVDRFTDQIPEERGALLREAERLRRSLRDVQPGTLR